jgi:hypothetical protein
VLTLVVNTYAIINPLTEGTIAMYLPQRAPKTTHLEPTFLPLFLASNPEHFSVQLMCIVSDSRNEHISTVKIIIVAVCERLLVPSVVEK